MDQAELRNLIRRRRRDIDEQSRYEAAASLAEHVRTCPQFANSRHIAFYLPNDGEIDLRPLLLTAWEMGKRCYLPVLGMRHESRMWFMPFEPGDPLLPNRYGILEPPLCRDSRRSKNWMLDLVLVPLVAFDPLGHRLGMGGGFYDRTFAYLHTRQYWRKPHLMGTGFSLQRVAQLPVNHWDIPLDSMATENGIEVFARHGGEN